MPLAKTAHAGEDEVSVSFLAHCRTRFVPLLCALALLVSAQEEKRLTVYVPQGGAYAIHVRQRNNTEYVPLLDVLQHLGNVTGKAEGKKFNLRFGDSLIEFRAGKNKVKIGGKNIDLSGEAAIEEGALLVPIRAVAPILNALLRDNAEYRETGRRIIIGAPVDFAAEMRTNPSRLVLHFSRPVNPTIASGPGHLRLNFIKDPVVAPESTQNFNDKLIPSATYSESGGSAVLTVTGSAPLMASFSDEGKTITITATPQVAVEKPPVAPAAAPPPAQAPVPAPQASQPAPTEAPARPRAVVVIDPAHGGDDRGAVLEPGSNEKDLTLAVARKLRAALDRQGIPAILLRDGDVTLNADDRAIAANTARALIYVGVHAGNVGRGVRIYTARMSAPPPAAGTMAPWGVAQAAYLDRSRELADSIAAQLARASVDHAEAAAQLQPLPHLTSAAVVLELLPDKTGASSLQSADYQQRVCAAVAEGIAGERRSLEARK